MLWRVPLTIFALLLFFRLLPPPLLKKRLFKVEEDRRYALLEYVSHLTARDYEATLNDLIVLGFIPKEIGNDPKKVILPSCR